MLSLAPLLFTSPASAQSQSGGSHGSPTYGGGTFDPGGGPPTGPPVKAYSSDSNVSGVPGYGGAAHAGSNTTEYAKGGITTSFTWSGSAPVPQTVIVTQTCVASWLSAHSTPAVIGSCDNGLMGLQLTTGPTQENNGPGTSEGYDATGTCGADSNGNPIPHYTAIAGAATLSLPTLNAMASITGSTTAGPLAASVSYTAAVSPVTIGLVGATSDGKGGFDVLVGQDVAPFLLGIPSTCTVSNYQWTVSGTTMQSWKVSSDFTHTTQVDGPGLLNIESPKRYWNDPSQTSETITCRATVTPPNGQGDPFPVTATQSVGVYLPVSLGKGLGGQMMLDAKYFGAVNAGDFCLYASPAPNQPGGMTWEAKLAPPQNCPVAFDKGNIYLVQVVTPSVGYIDTSNQQWESVFQGQLGIDTYWPYEHGWAVYEDDPGNEPYYVSDDSPGMDLTVLHAIYGSYMSSFKDYIMYQPPDSPEYVPLRNFKWNVNGTATIPSTNNWGDFKNPAGIIEPSGVTQFTTDNTYPSWTQNSGSTSSPWKKF